MTAAASAITSNRKTIRPSRRSLRSERRPSSAPLSPSSVCRAARPRHRVGCRPFGSHMHLLALAPRCFLGDPRRSAIMRSSFSIFSRSSDSRSGYFFLPAAKRRRRSRRATKHAPSPARPSKRKQQGNKAKNDQRQSESDADLHPLRK